MTCRVLTKTVLGTFLICLASACGLLESGDEIRVAGQVTYDGVPESMAYVSFVFSLGGCGFSGCGSFDGLGDALADEDGFFDETFTHERGCGQEVTVVANVQDRRVARSVPGCGQHTVNFHCTERSLELPGTLIYDLCR